MGYMQTIISIVGVFMPLVVVLMVQNFYTISFTLMINTVIPNALAAICFFIAGFYYKNEMEEL